MLVHVNTDTLHTCAQLRGPHLLTPSGSIDGVTSMPVYAMAACACKYDSNTRREAVYHLTQSNHGLSLSLQLAGLPPTEGLDQQLAAVTDV